MFAAMAALLVVALCVPDAFGDEALLFAIAYGVVRFAQIALFVLASRDDPGLRHSVRGLVVSTAIGVGLLVAASFADGTLQGALWALALVLDMGGPLLIDSSGWRLEPGPLRRAPRADRDHRARRVDRGDRRRRRGGRHDRRRRRRRARHRDRRGDVVAVLRRRRARRRAPAAERRPGRERNEIARDSFSYLHFPMVAGIVLVALGLKKTLEHVDDPLKVVPAAALLGGTAIYLLAHVAFRWRNVHRFSWQRLIVACCSSPCCRRRRAPALTTTAIVEPLAALTSRPGVSPSYATATSSRALDRTRGSRRRARCRPAR